MSYEHAIAACREIAAASGRLVIVGDKDMSVTVGPLRAVAERRGHLLLSRGETIVAAVTDRGVPACRRVPPSELDYDLSALRRVHVSHEPSRVVFPFAIWGDETVVMIEPEASFELTAALAFAGSGGLAGLSVVEVPLPERAGESVALAVELGARGALLYSGLDGTSGRPGRVGLEKAPGGWLARSGDAARSISFGDTLELGPARGLVTVASSCMDAWIGLARAARPMRTLGWRPTVRRALPGDAPVLLPKSP